MSKLKTAHVCEACGTHHAKWSGQCGGCGEWNTLAETLTAPAPAGSPAPPAGELRLLCDVDPLVAEPRPTGIGELDRVLDGGIVPGSVTLLGGEPGIGKSTLLLQLLGWWPGPALYVSAEESAQQVRRRAERLGVVRPDLWLAAETSLAGVVDAIERTGPEVVVVDSVQTVADGRIGSSAGSVVQVRECAHQLVEEAKRRGMAAVLAGHVTKDGALAGPRVLEHVVDTVLSFEGDRHHSLRMLRAVKHRYGSTNELGLFEMTGRGLLGVPDASRLFLADRRRAVPGSVVAAALDGRRPLLVEVQALTVDVPPGVPGRRNAQGVDGGRLALLLAVLERHAGLRATSRDVYASAVGGVRLAEPGVDLAVTCAVASSIVDRPLPGDVVVLGEVGLAGEVRQVASAPRRLAEAARLGFARAVVPASCPDVAGIQLQRVRSVNDALTATGIRPAPGKEAHPR